MLAKGFSWGTVLGVESFESSVIVVWALGACYIQGTSVFVGLEGSYLIRFGCYGRWDWRGIVKEIRHNHG